MVTEDRVEALAAAFTVLGRLHLAPPNSEAIAAILALLDEWPLAASGHTARGLEALRDSRTAGEDAERVRIDHDRLYGDSATAIVPPYESVHRGKDGLIFDTQTLQVRDAYLRLGLQAPQLNREPDDHLGLEFDFVAQGLLQALDVWDRRDDPAGTLAVVRTFLDEHLLSWAPSVLRKVATSARTAFMRGLAELSLGALDELDVALADSDQAIRTHDDSSGEGRVR